jgi:hypothetical protein
MHEAYSCQHCVIIYVVWGMFYLSLFYITETEHWICVTKVLHRHLAMFAVFRCLGSPFLHMGEDFFFGRITIWRSFFTPYFSSFPFTLSAQYWKHCMCFMFGPVTVSCVTLKEMHGNLTANSKWLDILIFVSFWWALWWKCCSAQHIFFLDIACLEVYLSSNSVGIFVTH